jgi:predicted nucleic acid-binding OB-fold protein
VAYEDNHASGSLWDDMPWWVKAIALVGVPSLISVGVIYSDRVQLADEVRTTRERVQAIERGAGDHDVRVNIRFQELSDTTKETNRILVASCVNAAQTALDRERCVGR